MAQDPPGMLPSAFQERFCLTERHVRCEMYKFAQTSRSAALEQEGIPVEQVKGARFRPAVRSVPLALGASEATSQGASGRSSRRPLMVAGAGIAAVGAVLVIVLGIAGIGGSGGGAGASPSPSPLPTPASTPAATVRLTLPPAPRVTSGPGAVASPDATAPTTGAGRHISYEVQEGEGLIRIAETFGVSRRRILNANEGMREQDPYVVPGDIIRVPVAGSMTVEEISAQPGFVEFTE